MKQAAEHAVEADSLVKTYPGGVTALAGLSITVRPGEVFGLLGPNGAGKSTTVNILTTLVRPDSGTASIAGHGILSRPDQVRRLIGVVSQRSGADPSASGRDNLLLQGRLYGMGGPALTRRVEELLGRFDLGEAAGRPVRTYSGGMQRRLDVALGLVHRPRVLFLDEPTTGLDPEARAAMWEEIARLAAGDSLAILLTTHYLDEADRLASRLAIVDRGRVVAEGTPDGLKAELRGDAVHLELSEPPDEQEARSLVEMLPGVREITLDGRRLSARADDGAAAVPVAIAALDQAGMPVAAVTVARPSLDDVYLRYAGRRFAQTDEPVAGGAR
ncbi:daunorubicin resistance protein DrrA family ABC transporter ATP-binding protein [Planotetraspora thailandica]|uniref:Daunorubicin resistance protein DrrA family ABC transporter ATP-binding protein n=1 Tax=Planotetraspora thailandica TaxID=487172 RepID=A0A8J3Y075_9ACTN|nr:ATP-binding cassette domain-containing protein [Planotetraspora thailandica]GII58432.1 daunorubicin resistance protein DrrA family ABC transporter ATP-binding protein [Planotetraspora thailandica]